MSKFYVGQRVRIKWSNRWPELNGQEGTIVEEVKDGGDDGYSEWHVAPDCWGTHKAPYPSNQGGIFFGPNSSQLEPISPPKQELSSWEKFEELFGWSPSKSKEAA